MKHANPDGYSWEEINLAFEYFLEAAQEVSDKYMTERFPTLPRYIITVAEGSTYWKLIREVDESESLSRDTSVHGFVRKSDGAIFKAASWKAPYTRGKNAIRGYVTDELARSTLTPHGIIYAQ